MAPLQHEGMTGIRSLSLQVPSMDPFYSSSTFSISTTSDINSAGSFSPRTLYAHSFDRPQSSRSLPSGRYRKNMKDITGFTTTQEDFEALPLAVRRKVRTTIFFVSFEFKSQFDFIINVPPVRHILEDVHSQELSPTNCSPHQQTILWIRSRWSKPELLDAPSPSRLCFYRYGAFSSGHST